MICLEPQDEQISSMSTVLEVYVGMFPFLVCNRGKFSWFWLGAPVCEEKTGPGGNCCWEGEHPKVCGFNTEVLLVTIEVIHKLYII